MDWDSLMYCQGSQNQKEGQEDQGEFEEIESTSALVLLAFLLNLPWPPWISIKLALEEPWIWQKSPAPKNVFFAVFCFLYWL